MNASNLVTTLPTTDFFPPLYIVLFPFHRTAEKPEDVASFLVPRVRRVPIDSISPINGSIHPSYVQFLTKPKAFTQLLARFLLGARKDRFVKEQ